MTAYPAADVVRIVQGNAEQKGSVVLALQEADSVIRHPCIGVRASSGGLGRLQHLEPRHRTEAYGRIGFRQVPLPRPGGAIPGTAEKLADVGDGEVDRLAVDVDTGLVGHASGDQTAARGTADG